MLEKTSSIDCVNDGDASIWFESTFVVAVVVVVVVGVVGVMVGLTGISAVESGAVEESRCRSICFVGVDGLLRGFDGFGGYI